MRIPAPPLKMKSCSRKKTQTLRRRNCS